MTNTNESRNQDGNNDYSSITDEVMTFLRSTPVDSNSEEDAGLISGFDQLAAMYRAIGVTMSGYYKALIDGGVPGEVAACMIRDCAWVYVCRVNGFSAETPIPPENHY